MLTALRRIPSADKIIDSRVLNRLGVQVARIFAARLLYRARLVRTSTSVASHVNTLIEDGVLVLPDFLAPEQLAAIRAECDGIQARGQQLRPSTWGPNTLTSVWVRQLDAGDVPAIRAFFNDERLQAIAAGAERRLLPALVQDAEVEFLVQGTPTPAASTDPQTICHSDTFFNTHKIWFYLDDVTLAHGPLAYIRGSHRLTSARLGFAYEHSWKRDPSSDPSRRIGGAELDRCGGSEAVLTCPANTLVIANTCGYHRRLQGQPGFRRRALQISLRANPFVPSALRFRRAG
jgi:hypothetical protein